MVRRLVYEEGGRRVGYPLEKNEVTLGRSAANDLPLVHGSVSRQHARLYADGGAWRIADCGSRNGTLVNGQTIQDGPLRHGDVIQIGDARLVFEDGEAAAPVFSGQNGPAVHTQFRSTVDFAALVEPKSALEPTAAGRPEDLRRLVTIVSDVPKAILESRSLDEVFGRILTLIFEHFPADRGFIMLWDEAKNELVTRCARDRSGADTDASLRFSRTIADKVLRERVAVLTSDAQMDARFAEGLSVALLGIRSAMAAPLWNGDRVNGLICLDTTRQAKAFDEFDVDLLSALGHHLAIAVEQDRLQSLALEKERLDGEMAAARDIQIGTLPKEAPSVPGYDLAGLSRPAAETGGDTYDLIPVGGDRAMLLLGDATGHGVGPALSATQVRSMLRVAMRLGASLDDTFRHINDQLAQDLADNRFVTAFLGLLDAAAHRITYHSGGQGPILHYRAAAGEFETRAATTFPLGFLPVKRMKEPQVVELEPGDLLALITDGVFETENPAGVMFGEAGVQEILRRGAHLPMVDLVREILTAVDAHGGTLPQSDDITIVLVRRLPTAGA